MKKKVNGAFHYCSYRNLEDVSVGDFSEYDLGDDDDAEEEEEDLW